MATILIVDDSAKARSEIKEALGKLRLFNRVFEAADGVVGLKLLLRERLDLVVCDLELPGFDAEKLLAAKDSNPGGSNLPFIVLTASDDMNRRARLIERGASDVVSKPFHTLDFVARLQLHLKIKRLQDELMVKNETLARLSTSDPVTGLRTRRYVTEVLSIEFLRARRYQSPLSIVMADLDHFKSVNDTYGHQAGDVVLRGVSDILKQQLRATDVGGRYGGEELLVILHQNEIDGAMVLAERWRQAIETALFTIPDGRQVEARISLGVAEFHTSMESPDDMIAAADQALYRAKEKGRNCCVAAECE